MRDIDRRLAAVWFADSAGFTPLTDRDEDAALEAVAAFEAATRLALEAALCLCRSCPGAGSRATPGDAPSEGTEASPGGPHRFLQALAERARDVNWPLLQEASVR
jgi:hypothetical protein